MSRIKRIAAKLTGVPKAARACRNGLRSLLVTHREAVRDYVQTFGILVAATWAVYQFYYVEVYKPRVTRPRVTITASLAEKGWDKDYILLEATVTYHNRGDYPVHVVSAFYNVAGYSVAAVDSSEAAYQKRIEAVALAGDNTDADRFLTLTEKTHLGGGKMLHRWRLQPGEPHTEIKTIKIPTDRPDIDTVVANFRVNVARDVTFLKPKWLVEGGEVKGKLCLLSEANAEDLTGCRLFSQIDTKTQETLQDWYGIGGATATSFFSLSGPAGSRSHESPVHMPDEAEEPGRDGASF